MQCVRYVILIIILVVGEREICAQRANSQISTNVLIELDSLRANGEYIKGVNIAKNALSRQSKIKDKQLVSNMWSSISIFYSDLGMADEAIDAMGEAISVRKKYMGRNYSINPVFSNNLATAYCKKQDNINAIFHLNEAIDNIDVLRAEKLNEDVIKYFIGITYSSLCSIYSEMQDYGKAEEYGLKSLDFCPYNEFTYVNLSVLYLKMYDYRRVIQFCNNAIEIMEHLGQINGYHYAIMLQNKAMALMFLSDYEESARYFTDAITILNGIGEDKFVNERILISNNVGLLLYKLNAYEKAKEYLELALQLSEEYQLTSGFLYVQILSNLGCTYTNLNEHELAIECNKKALMVMNDNHFDYGEYIKVYGNIAMSYLKCGELTIAREYLFKYVKGLQNNTLNYWQFMSAEQRTLYWERQLGIQYIFYYLQLDTHDKESAMLAYDISLFIKQLLLNTTVEINRILRENENKEIVENYNALKQLSFMADNAADIVIQRERIEKKLLELSKDYDDFSKNLKVEWNDVRDRLKENDVALEFTALNYNNEEIYYSVLILRKGYNCPMVINLPNHSELNKYLKNGSNIYAGFQSKELYNLIWGKIEEHIEEGDNVYFSPSGLFHQINIEALSDSSGKLACEKYNLHRVSSTRELCYEKPMPEYNSATLYGGLVYDMTDEKMIAQSKVYHNDTELLATRAFVSDSTYRDGWSYLNGSAKEVEYIANQMTGNYVIPYIYTSEAGTEESFKSLSGKKTPIIHIATHGFFYKNEAVGNVKFFNLSVNHNLPKQSVNPLRRAGLIFAGGQKAWLGGDVPDEVEDGILLAEEIALMDLSGTDLVVLSACETGLGEITSDGVFGLQRAFKMAGVQTLMMSLWRVSDNATTLMMQTFYDSLLKGNSKRDSFITAQNAVRKEFKEPHYWASFILLD